MVEQIRKDLELKINLLGQDLTLFSTWGLFSPEKIDEGSKLLLENIKLAGDEDIFDLGCGYGVLGLTLAKKTNGVVHLVDKDFVAVEYSRKNAEVNGIANTKIYLSNAFSKAPQDKKFDLIVSNLPAKVSKEMFLIMLHDAKEHLKPGGQIFVVTIAGLKNYIKRNFSEIFGNYKKVAHSKTYYAAKAIKL